jgi:hypothetical protein
MFRPQVGFLDHVFAVVDAGVQHIEFMLATAAPIEHVETIGRSRLTVGPGDRAVWDFTGPDS